MIFTYCAELFPTKIRYTSMSLPYHIGNGVFGGLVPFIGTLIIEYSKTDLNPKGEPLAGLWYPIGVASVCLVIGALFLSNTRQNVSLSGLKKIAGLLSMLLAPLAIGFLFYSAYVKLSLQSSGINDLLQWSIIIGIFAPIAVGLFIFGRYAYNGQYSIQTKE